MHVTSSCRYHTRITAQAINMYALGAYYMTSTLVVVMAKTKRNTNEALFKLGWLFPCHDPWGPQFNDRRLALHLQ